MSKRSKEEFLEWCRSRYPKRDRKGKSRMLDEICETLGWDRKHAIKALNGLVSLGRQAKKRGRQPKYEPLVTEVVVAIWRLSNTRAASISRRFCRTGCRFGRRTTASLKSPCGRT